MKLYYTPGACSLSPHIVLREAGLTFDLEKVDLAGKKTADGGDYLKVNPKGYVPALGLDTGEVLTEGPAIVQYLADRKPDTGLAPAQGSFERYRLQEWLAFINSELHKSFGALFGPLPEPSKQAARETIAKRFAYVEQQLAGKSFLMGNRFTVADAYLFVILSWANDLKIDLAPNLSAYFKRIAERPKVQEAMRAEGLMK